MYNVFIFTAHQLLLCLFLMLHLSPHCYSLSLSSSQPFYLIGVLSPPGRGFQLREQCTNRLAGDRGGHSNCDRDQPGAFEEEAIRHHQPWHRGGKPPIYFSHSVVIWGEGVHQARTGARNELLSILFLMCQIYIQLS